MSIVYEVTLTVTSDVREAFLDWLQLHVQEMLGLGFSEGRIYKEEGKENEFVVQYKMESREKLETYFEKHAPKMRKDGLDRFGDKMRASRRILSAVAT